MQLANQRRLGGCQLLESCKYCGWANGHLRYQPVLLLLLLCHLRPCGENLKSNTGKSRIDDARSLGKCSTLGHKRIDEGKQITAFIGPPKNHDLEHDSDNCYTQQEVPSDLSRTTHVRPLLLSIRSYHGYAPT